MQATRSPETRELSIIGSGCGRKVETERGSILLADSQAAASVDSFYAHALSAPVPFVPLPTIYSKI